LRRLYWPVLLVLLTEVIYLPPSVLTGAQTLYGWDYFLLHSRRLISARDALFSGHLPPAWYSREMLGSPFSANLQNFPWIPSHLALLLFPPDVAYSAGIGIAAALAASFMYLFCRRAGLSQIGAVSAAWTFSCAGFFAARIMVGHLLILEAYPSLPILLWLADRAMDPQRAPSKRRDVFALAIAVTCIAVAGHPQLPAYSVAATVAYIIWRDRGSLRIKLCGVVGLGIAMSSAAWWPMLQLIRRSTRVLQLDAASNDIALSYRRLLALAIPGIDGWPAGISLATTHPFTGYPNTTWFWDTFAYVGILPLVAGMILLLVYAIQRRLPGSRGRFLIALGTVALLGALPLFDPLRAAIPATILRSPARLLYVCTFCLCVGFGVGVDTLSRWRPFGKPRLAWVLVAICLVFHAWDLGRVVRLFIVPTSWHPLAIPEFQEVLSREGGTQRVAVSRVLSLAIANKYDDPGGYDSIFLADTYRSLGVLTQARAGLNEEVVEATNWPRAALEQTGVGFVVTWQPRTDLDLVRAASGLEMYRVANPVPRVSFVDRAAVAFAPREKVSDAYANSDANSKRPLFLAAEDGSILNARSTWTTSSATSGLNRVNWNRPSAGEFRIDTVNDRTGLLYVLEAHDPGWRAEVDGVSVPVFEANGLGMAIPVSAGHHVVRVSYHTPGIGTGVVVSVLSLLLLAAAALDYF
jgi:hypothetical protein